jgi:hypothetical protein
LNQFWKNLEKIKPCGARLSVALSEQRSPDRTLASRPWCRHHFLAHCSHRHAAIIHLLSWLSEEHVGECCLPFPFPRHRTASVPLPATALPTVYSHHQAAAMPSRLAMTSATPSSMHRVTFEYKPPANDRAQRFYTDAPPLHHEAVPHQPPSIPSPLSTPSATEALASASPL